MSQFNFQTRLNITTMKSGEIMANNPYQAYKQQSYMTMTQGDMLTALYDGLIKEIAKAQILFQTKDYMGINTRLQKAQSIVLHLQKTLDYKYEISNSLNSLYDYFLHVLVQANIKKDPSSLDELIGLITELRNTYIQADKQLRSGTATK